MSNQIKLRKGDQVREVITGEIAIVKDCGITCVRLTNGDKLHIQNQFSPDAMKWVFYPLLNSVERKYEIVTSPSKTNPKVGILGQPIVVDLDKVIL